MLVSVGYRLCIFVLSTFTLGCYDAELKTVLNQTRLQLPLEFWSYDKMSRNERYLDGSHIETI